MAAARTRRAVSAPLATGRTSSRRPRNLPAVSGIAPSRRPAHHASRRSCDRQDRSRSSLRTAYAGRRRRTWVARRSRRPSRSEEHTSELQSHSDLVCRLLLEKKKKKIIKKVINSNQIYIKL